MVELKELYEYAAADGIVIDEFSMRSAESLSLMDGDGDCYIAIDPFRLRSVAEERVKLSHELGHCVQGAFYNQYAAADLRARHEHRAEKWAIKKLVPQDELMAAVEDGRTEIWELAEIFGVTEDFMRKAVCWYQTGTLAG